MLKGAECSCPGHAAVGLAAGIGGLVGGGWWVGLYGQVAAHSRLHDEMLFPALQAPAAPALSVWTCGVCIPRMHPVPLHLHASCTQL